MIVSLLVGLTSAVIEFVVLCILYVLLLFFCIGYIIQFIMGLFGIRLFCWNWKFFAESIVDKAKS